MQLMLNEIEWAGNGNYDYMKWSQQRTHLSMYTVEPLPLMPCTPVRTASDIVLRMTRLSSIVVKASLLVSIRSTPLKLANMESAEIP